MRKTVYVILALLGIGMILCSQSSDSIEKPKYKTYRFRDGTKEIVQTNPNYTDTTRKCIKELKDDVLKLDRKVDSLIAKKKKDDDKIY